MNRSSKWWAGKRLEEGPRKIDAIVFKNVRTHNLKNIDVQIPHRSFTVITGVSGSGKSSLAFDTLYAEGRRRYVESLSAYARQFLERMEKPDYDFASGILPAIAIKLKNAVTNARSTVGTQTEILDYLRLLFARIGVTYCSSCGEQVSVDTPQGIFDDLALGGPGASVTVAFPFPSGKLTKELFAELERQGFLNFLSGARRVNADQARRLGKKNAGPLLVILDEVEKGLQSKGRLIDSLESAFRYGKGRISVVTGKEGRTAERKFSNRFHCARCNLEYRAPTPNYFSFNSPLGACPECQGFGRVITIDWNLVIPNPNLSVAQGVIEPWTKPSASWEQKQLKAFCQRKGIPLDRPFAQLTEAERRMILEGLAGDDYFSVRDFFKYLEKKTYKMHVRIFLSKYRGYTPCPKCRGLRLTPEALAVKVSGKNIAELSAFTVEALKQFFDQPALSEHDRAVAEPLLVELKNRLGFLADVGLGYLTLDRLSRTLSGGEAQRIHLAASLGTALVDTLYVLDEPSVGLHERDHLLLIRLLEKLRNLGNTVVVVEHDRKMIEAADEVIDLGPFGGERGGRIMFAGPFPGLQSVPESRTAKYFRGEIAIKRSPTDGERVSERQVIAVERASEHNLKNISVEIPLRQLVVITGVSGSGKSTLIYDVLYGNFLRARGRPVQDVGRVDRIKGLDQVADMVLIDQSQIGRTPRSNPVTYMQAFDPIRKIFASTPEAKKRGLGPGCFSFNVPGGRCETCEGDGVTHVEMHFLADVQMTCEACHGSRYQSHILEVRTRGKNIQDVLEMTVEEALDFFSAKGGSASGGRDHPQICGKLSVLAQVGLGYLRLGQPATTLSGGEAQRLKLAFEIARSQGENLLYLFDEPTTGLHYYDIAALLSAFEVLLERGHSLCIIEHNMEVIQCADYLIDLGPEGGSGGGEVVYQGPRSGIIKEERSHTGRALKEAKEAEHFQKCQVQGKQNEA